MILRLLRASLGRRPRQVLLIAVAVAVAAATVTTLTAFSARARAGLADDLAAFGPNLLVRPQVGGPARLAPSEVASLRQIEGLSMAAAVVEIPAGARREGLGIVVTAPGEGDLTLWAADATLLQLHPGWRLEGRWPGPGEAVLGADFGAGAPASLPGSPETSTLAVVGALRTGSALDRGALVALSSIPPELGFDRVEARVPRQRLEEIAVVVEAQVAGAEARPLLQVSLSEAALSRRVTVLLLAVSAVALALALLSVGAAATALLDERRVEVGLFLALGYSSQRVGGIFAAELLTVSALAALLGEVAGELAAGELAERVLGAAAVLPVGSAPLSWAGLAGAMAVAVLTVGAAMTVTLRRVQGLEPARVLRGE